MMPKLRAYDKVTQKIFDVEYINFTEQVVSLGGCRRRYFHEVEPMQSTGLHDKNGDEIYEGYIIEVHLKKGNLIFRVAKGCTQFVAFMGNLSNTLIEVIEDLEINNDFYEVVGNIYENRELLEGNHD